MAEEQHKAKYKQLRATVLDTFGTYTDPHGITFETMKGCPYLQWCISECLRLFPAVPINTRTAMMDTTLPTGGGPDGTSPVYVRKGADIVYSVRISAALPASSDGLLLHRFTSCTGERIFGVMMPESSNRSAGTKDVRDGNISRLMEAREYVSGSSLH